MWEMLGYNSDMEIILALLGTLEYRSNSYCEVQDTVFVLDYDINVKELQSLLQAKEASPLHVHY